MPSLRLEDHVFRIMENQLRMQEIHESHDFNWGVDLQTGRLTFADKTTGAVFADLPMQLLASQSDVSGTWLWSWANANGGNAFPASIVRLAESVRDFAATNGADNARFTQGQPFPLPNANFGHEIATICAGFGRAFGFYRCPYDDGAAWAVIESYPAASALPSSLLRQTRAISDAISVFAFNHRDALAAYLGEPDANGTYQSGLTVTFDEQGRIANLSATLKPATAI